MQDIYHIRYVKLHFELTMTEDCVLPKYKASAIRGGMGEMLLRANCIRDRKCENCDFADECIVQRTMYSKFENKPKYITEGDSIGYVVECDDYREACNEGDILKFNLILFGKTIVYFSQYVNALYALGRAGLGKDSAKFVISKINNTKNQPILDGTNIYMKNYTVEYVSDYITYRMKKIQEQPLSNIIEFVTPLTQKYRGEFLKEYNMDAIVASISRRVNILDYFENMGDDTENVYSVPEIKKQTAKFVKVRRYSSRQKAGMYLEGIKGTIELDNIEDDIIPLLLAGELLHIGKNTSFGFGKYRLK